MHIFHNHVLQKLKTANQYIKHFAALIKSIWFLLFSPEQKNFYGSFQCIVLRQTFWSNSLGLISWKSSQFLTNLWTSLKKLEIWQVLHTRIMTEIKDLSFYLVMGKGYGWLKKFRKGSKYPDWKLKCFSLKLKFLQDMWVMTNVEKDSTTLKIVT